MINLVMNVIKQTYDKFVIELGFIKLHWCQKLYLKIYDWWIRKHPWLGYRDKNLPCVKCGYYHCENNTCQSKKCCTGLEGYVAWFDRIFCKPKE